MSDPSFDLGENPAENLQRLTVLAFGKLYRMMSAAGVIYSTGIDATDEQVAQIADSLLAGSRVCADLLEALESQQSESEPVADES